MKPESEEKSLARLADAIPRLRKEGFEHIEGWMFDRDLERYDFSAADIDSIEDGCNLESFRVKLDEVSCAAIPDSSDIKKLIDFLGQFGVGFRIFKRPHGTQRAYTVRCDQGMRKVHGYAGFGSFFLFDPNGKFIYMGAWE